MLPCVCSVIDHRGRQNVVRTSVTHSAAPRVPLFCSYHILTSSVIYYWTDARQYGIYLLNLQRAENEIFDRFTSTTRNLQRVVTFSHLKRDGKVLDSYWFLLWQPRRDAQLLSPSDSSWRQWLLARETAAKKWTLHLCFAGLSTTT